MKDFSTLVQECSKDHILPFSPDLHDPYSLTLRDLDALEACAATGLSDPCSVLQMAVLLSDYVWVVVGKDERDVCAYFGIVEAVQSTVPWLLGSEGMSSFNPLMVARASKRIIQVFRQQYPGGLFNQVMSDYVLSIQWLKFLGADVQADEPVFLFNKQVPFYNFTL